MTQQQIKDIEYLDRNSDELSEWAQEFIGSLCDLPQTTLSVKQVAKIEALIDAI